MHAPAHRVACRVPDWTERYLLSLLDFYPLYASGAAALNFLNSLAKCLTVVFGAATIASMNDIDGSLSHSPFRLKRKRYEAGLGLREAADLAGVNAGHLSRLEHGKLSASPRHLAAFAEVYDCKPVDLMPPLDSPQARKVA